MAHRCRARRRMRAWPSGSSTPPRMQTSTGTRYLWIIIASAGLFSAFSPCTKLVGLLRGCFFLYTLPAVITHRLFYTCPRGPHVRDPWRWPHAGVSNFGLTVGECSWNLVDISLRRLKFVGSDCDLIGMHFRGIWSRSSCGRKSHENWRGPI